MDNIIRNSSVILWLKYLLLTPNLHYNKYESVCYWNDVTIIIKSKLLGFNLHFILYLSLYSWSYYSFKTDKLINNSIVKNLYSVYI